MSTSSLPLTGAVADVFTVGAAAGLTPEVMSAGALEG